MRRYILFSLLLIAFALSANAQMFTNKKALDKIADERKTLAENNRFKAVAMAKLKHWPMEESLKGKGYIRLVGVDENNHPRYYTTFNNSDAAATINTTSLWPGGSSGLKLNGSSANMKNKLGVWDGGRVLETHHELVGRITRMDSSYNNGGGSEHATHVTGTMIATGKNPLAKGMANGLQGILTYSISMGDDIAQVTEQSKNLLLSNHSYGDQCGWVFSNFYGAWVFMGKYGDSVDYNFGYYNRDAATLDDIAYNAPYYLRVSASGNYRDENGPAVGATYDYYDSNGVLQQGNRPDGISNNDGYQTIPTYNNAKNILTVGAIYPIKSGYTQPSDAVMSKFSSWGPTNDGRIKPDLVGDGVYVLSCVNYNDSSYDNYSGTSQAAPSITGALFLLQEYYSRLHSGNFMRAATLKGLGIHTANEAGGSPGPDYQFGWGILNNQLAAEAIKVSNSTKNATTSKHIIVEDLLTNAQTYSKTFTATGSGKLKATLSWTDPAGPVTVVDSKNKPIAELVNDLDLRIIKNGVIYYPWVLNPAVPAAAATKGDNALDNVEQVVIDNVNKGDTYTIQVSNKGTLNGGTQAFSLLLTQPGDTALPLKLISFKATLVSNSVQLKWVTANELNTQSFTIQSSTDGNNWNDISNVNAKKTTGNNTYSVDNIAVQTGVNYYRLLIEDADGSITYSSVQTVQIPASKNMFTILPNPANAKATLLFNSDEKEVTVVLSDVMGRIVESKQMSLQTGNTYQIETSKLPAGNYYIKVSGNSGIVTRKLLVIHN